MFVGNLDPRFATDKLLQDHFGQYGSIMACDIHLKRNEQGMFRPFRADLNEDS